MTSELKIIKMNHQDIRSTLCAIVLLCIPVYLTAQTEPVSNLPQYLYPDFSMSVVKLKAGTSITTLLNYNTVTEKMTFYRNGTLMNLDKPETVDTVFMKDKKFVYLENAFYEVLVNAPVSLFIQHKGILSSVGKPAAYGASSQTASSTSISKVYSDQAYNLKLPENLKVTPEQDFWIRNGNVMYKFTSERQFLKAFPAKENEIKTFIKKSNINIKDQDGLIKLVNYCNDLLR